MTLLSRVCGVLDAADIPHALIGAAALAARGVARSTYDIDLLTTDVRVLEAGLGEPLRATGSSVDIHRGDLDDPLGGTQDLWDVRALLALPERAELVAQVDADLTDLPADLRARWLEVKR